MLEVWKLGDLRFHTVAKQVLQFSSKTGEHRVPLANLAGKGLHIPLVPELTFVTHFTEQADLVGEVEKLDHRQMASQEVLNSTALLIAGVLRFAKGVPTPTSQPRADSSSVSGLDSSGVQAKPEVGFLASFTGPR